MQIEQMNARITSGLTVTIHHDQPVREFINYELMIALKLYYKEYGCPDPTRIDQQNLRVKQWLRK